MSNGKLSDRALKIVQNRYFMEGEDWEALSNRVGKNVGEIELYDTTSYINKFAEMIYNMDFLPGGRILRNAGRLRGSMFNCLAKTTEVLTEDKGFVEIQNLEPGQKILNGNGCFDSVTNVIQNGYEEELIEFVVDGFGKNSIMSTRDHKFLVFSYEDGFKWKTAESIEIENDFMVVPKLNSSPTNVNIKETLKVDSIVDIVGLYDKDYEIDNGYIKILNSSVKSKQKYDKRISPVKNSIEITPDFCRLVGYYLAEGTSIDNGNSIVFSFHENENFYQNEVKDLIYKYFGLECVIRDNTGRSKQVVVNSQIVNLFFANLFGRKSKSKKLPWSWFSLSDECLLETLVGGIRGDGRYIVNNSSITVDFATTNKLMTYQLFLIGLRLNIATSFTSSIGRKIKLGGNDYYESTFCSKFGAIKNNTKLVCRINDVDFNDNYSIFSIKKKNKIEYNDYVYDISMKDSTNPHFSLIGAVCHNCYVLPMEDSIEQIGQFNKDALILWSEGGGVGTNLSYLRPNGDVIKGKGGYSSGPVSFLVASDAIARTVECGGSRRAAGLACMRVNHPDVMDFMDAKLVNGDISHFNISVGVDEEFLLAVEKDEDWVFKFNQKSYGSIKARVIWDKIIENMVNCAEPGLLNFSNLQSNNSYYYDPVQATNPCGEATLAPYESCDLGSLVLPHFITGSVNTNWRKLDEVIRLAIRFLDNVIDCNKYVLREVDLKAHNGRRIGIGVMGLAEYLFAKKLRYGSPKAIQEVEKLMKFIRDVSYDESVNLAIEKGSFPKFDPIPYGKAHFVRDLPASLRMRIKENGIRNVTTMSIAPTGTISLLPEVTSSIEPLFCKAYRRTDRLGERVYIHPIYRGLLEGKIEEDSNDVNWFVDSNDLSPEDHFETQAAVQKYTDGAVSKTINMPKGTTAEDLSKLTLEYIYDLKGMTVYVDGSREGQILNPMSWEETMYYLKNNSESITDVADEETTKCANGKCEL